ncbi:endothelin-converting enzyme 1 [Moesziomyces antarcticus]|uniref:Related to Endothelin-converting enzyme 1 n=2 Tax=Pseudozyma antarctica TaxID=84753 RepID=A0A5C3FLP2_PSEA2|nr:endothelin-converting enzyme 1 [Moesziomyces antarcticus]GAK64382.1 endothelin-converting enzyme 1 [Moesziomyces antarcticus]SPO45116.1 related to Endothelin-converting enzyme 1 [Moesziomyces antarcticus]
MATHNYGRPSTDDHAENRPLLSQDHEGADDATNQSLWSRFRRQLSATFAPLAKPEELRPLERFLVVASVALLLLAAVFIGLFAGSQHKLTHRPASPAPVPAPGNPNPNPPEGDICTTKDCVLAASEILRSIDESVNPCDDFYAFSTNNWLKAHPIPGDAGLFGTGQFVLSENSKILRQILADAPSSAALGLRNDEASDKDNKQDKEQHEADRQNLVKLKDYYDACIDVTAQDKLGAKPLLDVLEHLRLLIRQAGHDDEKLSEPSRFLLQADDRSEKPVPPNQPPARSPKPHPPRESPRPSPPSGKRQKGLTEAVAWAHSRGLPAFFDISIDGDAVVDPTAATPWFFPSGLGLPDQSYYEDTDEIAFYKRVVADGLAAYDRELKHVKASGNKNKRGKSAPLGPLAEHVVEFERLLADITPDSEEVNDPVASYNPINTTALPYTFSSISWPAYFSALTVRMPERIILTSPKFVTALDALISRTKTDVLEAYLVWTAIREFGTALGPNVKLRGPAERLDRYSKGVAPDAKEDRETKCMGDLNAALGFMAGRYFVRSAFQGDSKKRVEQIIFSVIDAFKSRLPELDWLDEKTRKKAHEKADAIRVMVGYPNAPNTTDAVSVSAFYRDLPVDASNYFANRLASSMRMAKRDWAQVGRKLNRELWDMFPAEVNAEYSPQGNYILFPAGIMQPPYFHVSWPSYLQRGAFGAVAGHELSHAFDPDGRLYDKQGYLRDWWSEATAKQFQQRQTCLANQYHSYTVSDGKGHELHLRSNFTKGEDVADAGGLAQSYRAWKDELALGGDEVEAANALLPGLGYTREQLFFIAYGVSWARNIRASEQVKRLRTDPHSPTKYRVNGVLVNSPEFAEAFGCKAGRDKMAKTPEDRCSIW